MNNLTRILILLLLTSAAFARSVVNGDTTSVMATGSWEESHVGISLICIYLDNLSKISKRFYGDANKYMTIAKANNLEDPDKIKVGQELLIPAA